MPATGFVYNVSLDVKAHVGQAKPHALGEDAHSNQIINI